MLVPMLVPVLVDAGRTALARPTLSLLLIGLMSCVGVPARAAADNREPGFVPLFNGRDLSGWHGADYLVEDGVLVCPADGGGTLLTDATYADFIFRFEFRLAAGGNNGVGIRATDNGNPAYEGMEIQILDDTAPEYAQLQPYQYHGSIYGVVPARRGAQRPLGEWNDEEIVANGSHVRVTLNGQVIVDADLSDITDPELLAAHPGLRRARGHLGFMGHGHRVEFRNLRINVLNETPPWTAHNVAPEGFTALFNGSDFTHWQGLAGDIAQKAAMTPEQLAEAQAAADERMRQHWRVVNGELRFDGAGESLVSTRDYGNFELLADWKIEPGGDSGLYLRGLPQVQIWDNPIGSGGLYNNQANPSGPLVVADNPPGQWNTFRIRMVGDRVWIWLNDQLVVDNTPLENYWDRAQPIPTRGPIELQAHGSPLAFRNLFLRELDADGNPLTGPAD